MLNRDCLALKKAIWAILSTYLEVSADNTLQFSEQEAVDIHRQLVSFAQAIHEGFGVRLRANPSSHVKAINYVLKVVFDMPVSCCKQPSFNRVRTRMYQIDYQNPF